jgi:hypothetical protein
LRCRRKLSAEKREEMKSLSNDENEKCIEDYMEREIAAA